MGCHDENHHTKENPKMVKENKSLHSDTNLGAHGKLFLIEELQNVFMAYKLDITIFKISATGLDISSPNEREHTPEKMYCQINGCGGETR